MLRGTDHHDTPNSSELAAQLAMDEEVAVQLLIDGGEYVQSTRRFGRRFHAGVLRRRSRPFLAVSTTDTDTTGGHKLSFWRRSEHSSTSGSSVTVGGTSPSTGSTHVQQAAALPSATSADVAQDHCIACQDELQGAAVCAPCGHRYDSECALRLFEVSMQDEALFPPRCCGQQIPLSSVRAYMGADLAQSYELRASELKTQRRVYCASSSCGRFLCAQGSRWLFRHYRTCPVPGCGTVTCTRCKKAVASEYGKIHGAPRKLQKHVCEADPRWLDQPALELGKRSGWARCPHCKQMVERTEGCNHMSCRCGGQFCYRCSRRWWFCRGRCNR